MKLYFINQGVIFQSEVNIYEDYLEVCTEIN